MGKRTINKPIEPFIPALDWRDAHRVVDRLLEVACCHRVVLEERYVDEDFVAASCYHGSGGCSAKTKTADERLEGLWVNANHTLLGISLGFAIHA